ncbi:zinc finger BED domain-containing protein RICESLEEPER 2-like [Cannabis sativa]|uniref:zinc finger BED domain-containing protein RICESLEEPER 2-like n=1 Tax=Cannabis sativa TaxID=3483 RepID=UPI0029C9D32A|nr:zinc finger BED domain-containing protein RICESLEEPER 2-like [Cannabis sativa]
MDNEKNVEEMIDDLTTTETNLSSSDGDEPVKERRKGNVRKNRNDRQMQDKDKSKDNDKDKEKDKGKKGCEKEKGNGRLEKKQRIGKKTSSIWDHYTMLPDCDPEKLRAACNYCGTNYTVDTKLNGTSTLWAHVERKCKKYPFSDWVEQNKRQQSTIDRFTKNKTTTCNEEAVASSGLPLRFNQNLVRKAIAEYIIMDELPFRHVDGKGFQKLIKLFFDDFQFPSRFTVARDIYQLFLDRKKELKAMLKMQKRIINFLKVPSHKGDLVEKELINCLDEWGISKVFAVTVDNASSNDVALRKLKGNLFEKDNTVPLNGKIFHMRWNSTYMMLEAAIKFKKNFDNLEGDANYTRYFDEERMAGPPSNLDWEKAGVFVSFLKRLYDLTNRFSGSLYVTSNLFLPNILKVQADLITMASSPDTLLGTMAISMKRKYDKYWGRIEKLNMLTFIANILDPRYKLEVVNRDFRFVYNPSEAEKMIKLVTDTLAQLCVL